eukprot:3770878-Rhodomonas_salina.1
MSVGSGPLRVAAVRVRAMRVTVATAGAARRGRRQTVLAGAPRHPGSGSGSGSGSPPAAPAQPARSKASPLPPSRHSEVR